MVEKNRNSGFKIMLLNDLQNNVPLYSVDYTCIPGYRQMRGSCKRKRKMKYNIIQRVTAATFIFLGCGGRSKHNNNA